MAYRYNNAFLAAKGAMLDDSWVIH